jgi:hypothetical protein
MTRDDWMRDGWTPAAESMEKYIPPLSEQAVNYPEGHPDAGSPISPISDSDRVRALVSVMRRVSQFVGEGGGPDLPSRLDFILASARRGNLPASLYETIWELRAIFTEHVIIDHAAKSNLSDEIA